MTTDYVVVHSEPTSAQILKNQDEIAILQKIGNGVFALQDRQERENWVLSMKVDGEMRPFSMACYKDGNKPLHILHVGAQPISGELCLRIKDHIFSHNNNFYSIGEAVPEGASARDCISGSKYICRFINFPFSHIDHVDEETKHQMKRYRGIAVGEIGGLGADGYHLILYDNELADIGLQLVASTYLIYTTR
ncbi:MAG TPA: hypothetical protein VJN71_02635 [Nitrososphaerales archaeon]|nr:hypothetical protein [Nitrososphaerales archaeon]